MIQSAILILILSLCYQVYLWCIHWRLPQPSISIQKPSKSPAVTVVIAACNAAVLLHENLPAMLEQDYANYQVIVVDDGSTDKTPEVLKSLCDRYPILSFHAIVHQGKKAALSAAINKATTPWILCTDADCMPSSFHWISEIMKHSSTANLILGYGPYHKRFGIISSFHRYETCYIALQYLSAAHRNSPYMGVGRNMAFTKDLWEQVGGYATHQHIKSGDDDLFVQEARRLVRPAVCIDRNAWMLSDSPTSWTDLWSQKRRHLSTSPSYDLRTQVQLFLVFLTHLFSYFLPILLAYWNSPIWLVVIPLRWLMIWTFGGKKMALLGAEDLRRCIPLYDVMLLFYYLLNGFAIWKPKKGW